MTLFNIKSNFQLQNKTFITGPLPAILMRFCRGGPVPRIISSGPDMLIGKVSLGTYSLIDIKLILSPKSSKKNLNLGRGEVKDGKGQNLRTHLT